MYDVTEIGPGHWEVGFWEGWYWRKESQWETEEAARERAAALNSGSA